MHPSDLLGFEPRYFNFSDLQKPSDPSQSLPLSSFIDELPFWGINSGHRPPIYAAINGVVLYNNLGNPEEYIKFIEGIGVEMDSLAEFTSAVEQRYCRLKSRLDEQSNPNASVMAFTMVVQDFTRQISERCEEAEIPAWCGVFFAMGMCGAYTGTELASDLLSKWETRSHNGEAYLFEYVRNVSLQFDFANETHPLDRFLGYCYLTTPYERLFVTKRVLSESGSTIVKNNDEHSLAQIFMRSHDLAGNIARDEPETLQRLLFDIEQGIGPGTVKENMDCFKRHLGACDTYPWSFTTLWDAGRALINEQHPSLIPELSGHARRIAELSYFQRMIDFAIWSALFGSAPDAFKNFTMEPYSKLLESAPSRLSLN